MLIGLSPGRPGMAESSLVEAGMLFVARRQATRLTQHGSSIQPKKKAKCDFGPVRYIIPYKTSSSKNVNSRLSDIEEEC